MKKTIAQIAPDTRVAVANFVLLGTIVARVAKNTYSVKFDNGQTLPAVSRTHLSRWDEKAGRAFSF